MSKPTEKEAKKKPLSWRTPEEKEGPTFELDPDKLGLLAASLLAMLVFAYLSFVLELGVSNILLRTLGTFVGTYFAVFIMVWAITQIVLPEIEDEEPEEDEEADEDDEYKEEEPTE